MTNEPTPEDHVNLWLLGDMNNADTVIEWLGNAVEHSIEYPDGRHASIMGYTTRLRCVKGLNFNQQFERTVFIPDDLARSLAEHILESLEQRDDPTQTRFVKKDGAPNAVFKVGG